MSIEVGDEIRIHDGDRWYKVANPNGIRNSNAGFAFGDPGVLKKTFRLKILAVGLDGDTLVQVISAQEDLAYAAGTDLPSGTLIVLSKIELERLIGLDGDFGETRRNELSRVKRLMALAGIKIS